MSYLVLARKYRPAAFNTLAGQEHVTRALQNAIVRGKVGHAYLFAGPRGVGKTSIARIFSKSLNCAAGPTITPCLQCSNCIEIAQGNSIAVREIDGASHNSVDNVRDLIDSFRMLPPEGSRYKVYIIDEVHMLSTAAFNALLKSLEEPPPNTVFVLATTEVHKIPDTVLSRCQRHDLRALPLDIVASQLAAIAEAEGVAIEQGALKLIARVSEGSMRDAQSLLDRVFSYSDGAVSDDQIASVLGVAGKKVFFETSRAVLARDPNLALELLQRTFANAVEPAVFLRDFAAHWRELLLVKFCGQDALIGYGLDQSDIDEAQSQVAGISSTDLQDLVDIAREGADAALRSIHPRYALESLLVRMATREPVEDLVRLVAAVTATHAKSGGASAQRPVRSESRPTSPPDISSRSVESPKNPPEPVVVSSLPRPLEWKAFVAFVADGGGRIMGEHLKRLEVVEFAPGTLRAQGQEFSVGSLGMPGTKEKLDRMLADYSGIPDWRVSLTKLEGSGSDPAAGSLLGRQQAQEQHSRATKEAEIRQHPAMVVIQQEFPGSTIEKVEPQK